MYKSPIIEEEKKKGRGEEERGTEVLNIWRLKREGPNKDAKIWLAMVK